MSLEPQDILNVRLFGRFRIATSEGAEITISNRRGRAILAMLCLIPGEPIEREQICKLFWSRSFKTQARASLRQCLYELNRKLQSSGLNILELQNTWLAVNPTAVRTDLQILEAALSDKEHAEVTTRMAGLVGQPLLADMELGDEVYAWLAAQRLQVESRLQIATERLLSDLKAGGKDKEYNELQRAWQSLNSQPGLLERRGIAVLPFKQIDELDDDFFLAEGAVEELSSQLRTLKDIALTGRTSVDAVVSKGLTLTEIAAKLNVAYLVEGTAHRTAERVRLSIRLIDGSNGQELWADKIDGTAESFLGSRQLIGSNIIAGFCQVLGLEPTASPHRRMTAERDAYVLYLQGRALIQRSMNEGAVAKAIELLEQALTLDPDFAECWTTLAEANIHSAVYTPCLDRVARSEQAAVCSKRALELNPGQGYALSILGIHEWTRCNPAGALEYALKAYRLEPNNADVTVRLGSFLLYLGRTREALPYIQAAVEQDPVSGRNYAMLSVAHLNLGNIDQAIASGQRMVDLGMPSMWLAVATAASGQRKLAIKQYRQTRLLINKTMFPPAGSRPLSGSALNAFWQIAARGVCSGSAVHRKVYCAMLDHLYKTLHDSSDTSIVQPAIWMGYEAMVFKTLGRQITPANVFCLMSMWSDIEPIRNIRLHPDFMAFAERIGLVKAWQKYGWPDLIPHDLRNL